MRRFAGALALVALLPAAWFSIRLSRADAAFREGTPEAVARALDLAPWNTSYRMLRALQVQYDGGDARPLLEEAARITPRAAAPRIRLGLDAEARGDVTAAERWLLDAAQVDHQYEPRWTLANFYFRQRNMGEFWKWVHAALEVSYGDRTAAFDLCWEAEPDAGQILARAIPPRHEVLAAYVWYLRGKGSRDTTAAIRLSEAHDPGDAALLDLEMDRLLAADQVEAAKRIWMNLGYALASGKNLLLDPDFGSPRAGHGFDWRMIETAGVTFTPLDTPHALRVSFNGNQPETVSLVQQFAGVIRDKKYVLGWEARGAATGLFWRVGAQSFGVRGGEDWVRGEGAFVAGRDDQTLELIYARPLGEARTDGSLELRHVSLEEQP